MIDRYRITVTWLDGRHESLQCVDYSVRSGVLTLMRLSEPVRYIPLIGVRWYDAAGAERAADERL